MRPELCAKEYREYTHSLVPISSKIAGREKDYVSSSYTIDQKASDVTHQILKKQGVDNILVLNLELKRFSRSMESP